MVGVGTAPDQRAPLQRGDDEVHRLRGHECPARELGTRQAVALAQHAQRHVLGRGDAVAGDRLVEADPQPALDAVDEIPDAGHGRRAG